MHTFDPSSFIALAEHLLHRKGEAGARAATSRAYYGAFLLARQCAKLQHSGPAVHRLTQASLDRLGLRHAARSLRCLRAYRNQADYALDRTLNDADARKAARLAREIERDLAGLRRRS